MYNEILTVALISVCVAQLVKLPIYYFKKGKIYWGIIFSTGSMPSSHTAFVVAITLAIGHVEGYNSSIYALSMVFALITIHDAIKVRGESSKQAVIVNQLTEVVSEISDIVNFNTPKLEKEKKLKELIGHTTSEVFGGILVGIFVVQIYFNFI